MSEEQAVYGGMNIKKCRDCPFKSDVSTSEGVKWLCNITKKMLYITKCVKEAAGDVRQD